jgi:anthranilate 1,2-dioxygenase large subunit
VPHEVFTDPQIYRLEMERLFRGEVWNYLGMECEIPQWGDFQTTWIGDTQIVVTRAKNGDIHAFENSCAHRGSRIIDKVRGNAKRHTCPYHLWTYNLAGDLTGVPLKKGHNGKGGMPPCFDKKDHGLRTLRMATRGGLTFGTYSDATETLEDYLGLHSVAQIDRLLVQRKPKVIGYLRQKILGNWKLYNENVRDPYHTSLLHLFQISFGIQTPAMRGGIKLDKDGKTLGTMPFRAPMMIQTWQALFRLHMTCPEASRACDEGLISVTRSHGITPETDPAPAIRYLVPHGATQPSDLIIHFGDATSIQK